MKAVQNNPYRTVGLLVGATTREQDRQIKRLKQYIEAEQDPQDDFCFPVLGPLDRTIESINDASSRLNLDIDKMNSAMFWFWNGNPISDEAAFDALKDGDTKTAYQIWDKLMTDTKEDGKRVWKELTEKNNSAFHNSSVLSLITNQLPFVSAVVANIKFIDSVYFDKFVKDVVDETFKVSKLEIQLNFLNSIFENVDTKKLGELIKYFNDYDFVAKKEYINRFIQKPIEQIEQSIDTSKSKRKTNKAYAHKSGQELIRSIENDLARLKLFTGPNDLRFTSIADKVANEILQCSLDYFNANQGKEGDGDFFEITQTLVKHAETIAVGTLIKDRIKDSISTLGEMKDREVSEAVQLLKSIKLAYEENEKQIKQHIKSLEETDLDIMLGRKTINHKAVKENIRNSIDWKKVNELFASILSDHKLIKIKASDNSQLKLEFIDLANWVQVKALSSSTIEDVLSTYEKIPPKLPFKILSSVVTNTNNKPLYSKFVRYIGLTLNVQTTAEKSVTFYVKYIKPNGNIDRNSRSSPNRYTLSSTSDLNLNTTSIPLSGWGNSDKCSFDMGEHRIEVYMDEYLIHSKIFLVDLAPSEKIEIELKKAEEKLKEIQNTQYFKAELNALHSQLDNIKGWKLLRSQADKEVQISEHQKIINNLIKKSSKERALQISNQEAIINNLKSNLENVEY